MPKKANRYAPEFRHGRAGSGGSRSWPIAGPAQNRVNFEHRVRNHEVGRSNLSGRAIFSRRLASLTVSVTMRLRESCGTPCRSSCPRLRAAELEHSKGECHYERVENCKAKELTAQSGERRFGEETYPGVWAVDQSDKFGAPYPLENIAADKSLCLKIRMALRSSKRSVAKQLGLRG
jgi:hypothetical protein